MLRAILQTSLPLGASVVASCESTPAPTPLSQIHGSTPSPLDVDKILLAYDAKHSLSMRRRAKIVKRSTSIGRLASTTATVDNPSIVTFFMTLSESNAGGAERRVLQ